MTLSWGQRVLWVVVLIVWSALIALGLTLLSMGLGHTGYFEPTGEALERARVGRLFNLAGSVVLLRCRGLGTMDVHPDLGVHSCDRARDFGRRPYPPLREFPVPASQRPGRIPGWPRRPHRRSVTRPADGLAGWPGRVAQGGLDKGLDHGGKVDHR